MEWGDGVIIPVTACGFHMAGPGPGLTSFAIPLRCVPKLSGLKGVFVGLPPRSSEESESSMSLYKQVQGSENHPLPGGPGGTAMPEVS